MRNIFAVAGIVIKELYRRKDFYVLFILTVLVCLIMGSVNIFNDKQIVRYLKELCLLLIWVSSLVIAITTTAREMSGNSPSATGSNFLPTTKRKTNCSSRRSPQTSARLKTRPVIFHRR